MKRVDSMRLKLRQRLRLWSLEAAEAFALSVLPHGLRRRRVLDWVDCGYARVFGTPKSRCDELARRCFR